MNNDLLLIPSQISYFFHRSGHHRVLHSFPTRRSSDLECLVVVIDGMGEAHSVSEYCARDGRLDLDRKSTRLNSSHQITSYAVFCLKKKTAPPIDGVLTPPHVDAGNGGGATRLRREAVT